MSFEPFVSDLDQPFFPNPTFGWVFIALLTTLLAIAAVIDLRRAVVPKWLSLTTLALGVACNVVRGASLGGMDQAVWNLPARGMWIGAADGFLFALAGFFTGFAIFFLMWIMGAAGGGDVKLFAALSAWVGPYISVRILVLSTLILIVLLGLKLGALFLIQSPKAALAPPVDKKGATPRDKRSARGMTYALPLLLASALALLWFFRVDLNLR